jgi:hypothetical protein
MIYGGVQTLGALMLVSGKSRAELEFPVGLSAILVDRPSATFALRLRV